MLAQPYDDRTLAEHIAEAFRWAWPELAHGAPTFENVLKHSMIALRQAGKPLTRLADLLTCHRLLKVGARGVYRPAGSIVLPRPDRRLGRDAAVMKESTSTGPIF